MNNLADRIKKLSPKQLLLFALDQQKRLDAAERRRHEPIAVIGMSCRFPGGADNPLKFWELLDAGRDATREVPADRWDIEAIYDPNPDAPARMSVRTGGFLDVVSGFDAPFFGIAPREAMSMDPQQRLLLEVAWETLEHAGLSAEQLAGTSTGVFVGVCNSDHFIRMLHRGAETIDAYLASGNAPSVTAGRIAYCLGLHGPAIAVDTACSSSLVAIHLACRSLRDGESRLAFACGVNIISSPETSIALSKAHMLAPDGRCKSFDAKADGFARGEGCGVLLLKRLSDATADGDNILAVIRGSAVNQDGRSSGLTVPNGPAQEAVVRAALADAAVEPFEVDYVEAHGTGTSLGDPIEARALSRSLGADKNRKEPLLIGSVKTNIGHLEGAAGIAGVIKVILSMQYERIPPHLHFHQPTPHIPWSEYRLSVTGRGHAWPRGKKRRVAGVSSFGFSGTNGHIVIEEAPPPELNVKGPGRPYHCLPLSARSDTALIEIAALYADALASHPDLILADVAATAGAGRSHFSHRLAIAADTSEAATDALRAFLDGKPHPVLSHGIAAPARSLDCVFLFAGPEAEVPGSARHLYDTSNVYRETIDLCAQLVGPDAFGRTLTSELWSSSPDSAWQIPRLFATQYAMSRLWKSFGVDPAAVIGYAEGEFAAACVAGVLSLEDALRLIVIRDDLRPHSELTSPDEASNIEISAPHIPVIWTGTGSNALGLRDTPDADYWQQRPHVAVRFEEGITGLQRDGYRDFLVIGLNATLVPLTEQCLSEESNLYLASPHSDGEDWREIANTLAQLYVRGMAINWVGVGSGTRKVPLPTYPFERQKYWYSPIGLDGQRFATPIGGNHPGTGDVVYSSQDPATDDDLFYQVAWEPAPLTAFAAPSLVGPAQFAPALLERFATLSVDNGMSVYDCLLPMLDRISSEYVGNALCDLGFDATIGRQFALDSEAPLLGIAPRNVRFFARLLEMLAEDGVVRHHGMDWEIVGPLPLGDPDRECEIALERFGDVDAELLMLRRCGAALARVLTGDQDPLQLLFPGGSFKEAHKLYVDSPYARTYNAALGEALASSIADLPPGKVLRVLEIGAGTGGTTTYVLPLLPADGVEYTFTDVSPIFLERAAERFAAYPFLRTAMLNIEKSPFEQGFEPGQFDLIIAANVLHATADLAAAVRRARELLSPGGMLFLLEGVAPQRWGDLTFGMTDGWWRFTDTTLRPNYPLIDTRAWSTILSDIGFADIVSVPGDSPRSHGEAQQALIIARASAYSRRWTVVGASDRLGDVVASGLRDRGDIVTVLPVEAIDAAPEIDGDLIYLGALELKRDLGDAAAAVEACEALAIEQPVRWLARFGAGTESGRAWIATCGSQLVAGERSEGARWQAPIWGVGRAFALEQSDRWGGLVDLAPDESLEAMARALIAVLDESGTEDQTAYRAGVRYVPRLVHAPAPETVQMRFRPDATYLITGGFGGLGLLVARWMAENGAGHLALLGRNPNPNSDAIREITALGARVIPLAGDISDEAGMMALLARLGVEAPPLRGIMHAATDVTVAPIAELTQAQIRRTLLPKIQGTVVLQRVTRNLDLDFLVLFSSTASLLGAIGLSHYAAANVFLDATAQAADQSVARILSINWGVWDTTGPASENMLRLYRAGGMLALAKAEALDALGGVLAGKEAQAAVVRADWSLMRPQHGSRSVRPFLSHLGAVARPAKVLRQPAVLAGGTTGLLEGLGRASAEQQEALMLEFVGAETMAVLGLGDATIPIELNLFEAGMDSLMSLELRRRLEHGVARSLPPTLVFTYPTIGEIAAFLQQIIGQMTVVDVDAAATSTAPQVKPRGEAESIVPERRYPMSFSQRALWFLHLQAPESTAYHVSMPARISGPLDVDALREAVDALVERHAILRTTYAFIDGVPFQRVADQVSIALEIRTIGEVDDDELRAVLESDANRPFDLDRGPALRASLYAVGPSKHLILLTMHHIAADGWSLLMLLRELVQLYDEMANGTPAKLGPILSGYGDYAIWQEQFLDSPEGQRLWSYWREKLAALPERLRLPTDRPRPMVQSFRGSSLSFQMAPELTRRVQAVATKERTTGFVVMLACFQAFLYRLGGSEDLLVGTPTFGRSKPEFMQVMGDFVNSVAIRGRVNPGMTFREFVAQLSKTVIEALDAQDFPLPLLVQRLQPVRQANSSPLFDVFFIHQRFDQLKEFSVLAGSDQDQAIQIGDLRISAFPIEQGAGQFDLTLHMVEIEGSIRCAFKYSTDLFDRATVEDFIASYIALVDELTADPGRALGAVQAPHLDAEAGTDDVSALFDRLRTRGIQLSLSDDGRLRVNGPKGALDDQIVTEMTTRRAEIISTLQLAKQPAMARDFSPLPDAVALRRIPRDGPLPVSFAQQRLWFVDQMDPGRSHYNIGGGIRYHGTLDVDVLARAIHRLGARHESLRASISERDSEPWLRIAETADMAVDIVDLSQDSPATREADAIKRAEALLRRPFDMARGRLAAFLIIRLSNDDHILVASLHHVISDGWSLGIILGEICELYDAAIGGRPSNLPIKTIDYVDYAAWERNLIKSSDFQRHVDYWKQQLKGIPAALELPTDRPRPATPSFKGGRLRCYFDRDLIPLLEAVSRKQGATLFMTLLAAWQVLLHLYSGQDDIVVGTPVANRDRPELEPVVGCLVNNVPLRGRLGDDSTFFDFLEQIKQTTLNAFDHRELPFDMLVQAINPERSVNHAPIFQVLFALMSFPVGALAPTGLSAEALDLEANEARFDLAVEISPVSVGQHAGQYLALYEYSQDLYEEQTIRRLHEHFANLLRLLTSGSSHAIRKIALNPSEQDRQLLESWNATGVQHDRLRCVHHLLEDIAHKMPDLPAVTAGELTLTYRDLNRHANRLAHQLVQMGIGPGALVAVCLDRTVQLPIALAGVLKAGAAYVPLDPTHPTDRIRYTLEDSGVACVITLSRFAAMFDSTSPVVLMDDEHADMAPLPDAGPNVAIRPEDLAYVIYTSGSTGRPKGVQVEHRNMVSFLEAMRREPGLSSSDILLAVTTPAFDIAGLEFWLPLSVGAHIIIASRSDVLDGSNLIELIEEHAVTALQATPATWRLMLEAGWTGRRELKALCGGEALPRELAGMLIGCVGELWNMYGPTETTVWSTVNRVLGTTGPISIGRPIANTRVYVLDPSGERTPVGVIGELCIGGEGVARGYLNRPELTAEKFVNIVTGPEESERVYRTGDMARFRSDGQLEFLGRRDQQVKLRGYRIELGEIEAVLAEVPGVRQSVVIVREFGQGDERLVGYVVLGPDSQFDNEAARAALRLRLPEYMVPSLFAVLPVMPLTPNGKIDRKALPEPGAGEQQPHVLPETLMTGEQRRVAAIWRDVLRSERIGLYENFFDIGGHSLLLVRLHAELKREFENDFPLVELFQHTTVAAQAGRMLSQSTSRDAPLPRARVQFEGALS
jgi:amino acid adenylation domain-containing protein